MSQANFDYVIKHSPEIVLDKVEAYWKSIGVIDKSVSEEKKIEIRKNMIFLLIK